MQLELPDGTAGLQENKNPFLEMEQHARELATRELAAKGAADQAAKEAAAEAERAARAAARENQKRAGCLDLPVFPAQAKATVRPVRNELTVEQHAIFAANDCVDDFRVHKSGRGSTITVGKVHKKGKARGVLKQIHQDLFYRLLELWEEDGYPFDDVRGDLYGGFAMSAYGLVKAITGNDREVDYQRVQDDLRDLAGIPIVLENARTWAGLVDRVEFTLLDGVKWIERKVDKATGMPRPGGESRVSILFSSFVTEGFLEKNVKILHTQPYLELGGGNASRAEIARLLYPMLDGQLATKDEYHAKLDALAERFALSRYRYKSKRREKFTPAVRALDGKAIQAGRYMLRVSIEEAKDGSDYLLVARREMAATE